MSSVFCPSVMPSAQAHLLQLLIDDRARPAQPALLFRRGDQRHRRACHRSSSPPGCARGAKRVGVRALIAPKLASWRGATAFAARPSSICGA